MSPALASFIKIYFTSSAAVGVWFVLLSLSNALFFHLSRNKKRKITGPKISVYIPARNEEHRISTTLQALAKQNYNSFEVFILNDNSTDNTWEIINKFCSDFENFNAVNGNPLPEGWKGKPFAMHQLGKLGTGELFVFLDADIIPEADFLSWVAAVFENKKIDTMSAYARHKAHSFLEYIFFPVMYLSNMTYLPFWLIGKTKNPLFSHAIGQLMVFRSSVYRDTGGFEIVKTRIIEDVQMGREIKKAGFRHEFLDAGKVLTGFMYDSLDHVFSGIKRTIFDYFDKKPFSLISMVVFLSFYLILPPLLLAFSYIFGWPYCNRLLLGNLFLLGAWMITLYDRKMPWYVPVLYPVQFTTIVFLAISSLVDELNGKGFNWKGRRVL